MKVNILGEIKRIERPRNKIIVYLKGRKEPIHFKLNAYKDFIVRRLKVGDRIRLFGVRIKENCSRITLRIYLKRYGIQINDEIDKNCFPEILEKIPVFVKVDDIWR